MTFELYVIKDDLSVNPVAANARDLRDIADVCALTFPAFTDAGSWLSSVFSSANGCNDIRICQDDVCVPMLDESDEDDDDDEGEGLMLGFKGKMDVLRNSPRKTSLY